MERARELDLDAANRGRFDRKVNSSPTFSGAKPFTDAATYQSIGDVDFGPFFSQASVSYDARELMVASTSSPLSVETSTPSSGYLSANVVQQPIAFGAASALASFTSDSASHADFWPDNAFVPFDLHYPPATQQQGQQQVRLQNQSPNSTMTKPTLAACGASPGSISFGAHPSPSTEDPAFQYDIATALSSLLDESVKFAHRQSADAAASTLAQPTTAPMYADQDMSALPESISMTDKPPSPQSGSWSQSVVEPSMENTEATYSVCSTVPSVSVSDECSLVSPTTVEKKGFDDAINNLRLPEHSSGRASSKLYSLLSAGAGAMPRKEPIPFCAQPPLPEISSTSSATMTTQYTPVMPAAPSEMGTDARSSFRQNTSYTMERQSGFPQYQHQASIQSSSQSPFQRAVSSPAGQYGIKRPFSSSRAPVEAEQWRRQLMMRRSNVVGQFSGAALPFGETAFATAISTPRASSDARGLSRATTLGVPYQSPANKRARTAQSLTEFASSGAQSTASSRHFLLPPPPLPLQNGIDGIRSSIPTLSHENRAAFTPPTALWQGFPRLSRFSLPTQWSTGPPVHPRGPPQPLARPPPRQIGIYSPQERLERIRRFHEKRQQRVFHKRVKYDCRKRLANACPRIKGRFVRRDEYLAAVESGQHVTHPHGGEPSADSCSRAPREPARC